MDKPHGIEALSFDCYGTLVDWRRGIADYVKQITGSYEAAFTILYEWLREDIARVSRGYKPYSVIVAENLKAAMKKLGFEYKEEYGRELAESIPEWPLFPDTKKSLERLKEMEYKLYVVSNIENRLLEKTLDRMGVEFDGYYTAEMAGVYKPNPRVLFNAYKSFGVPVWRGLHVSSSIDYDIRPAMVLGLRTAWINRYGEPEPEEGIAAEYIAGSLEELVEELAAGSEGRDLY